ncbi:hypothetical protein PAHAL_4G068100 [Panicum hallii]|jgi:hypothetical protein|uniref:Uncharacterized protein n=1 Tax=Panicum hallii TaxID=206008 RepID=A0A2T8JC32_9POAL|nr:uncharacterized protein LOC112889466 [Panicum hallii]PVH47461.1 hypothetical protein PAHAL_4G068100 [Panicum hallii]
MDASPSSPSKLGHRLRTTVCCCFGGGSGAAASAGTRWRRRGAAAGEFRYDALSYALNFDEGGDDDDACVDPAAAFRYRNFNARLPPSPPPAAAPQRAAAIAIA